MLVGETVTFAEWIGESALRWIEKQQSCTDLETVALSVGIAPGHSRILPLDFLQLPVGETTLQQKIVKAIEADMMTHAVTITLKAEERKKK
jgi:hypothetical protein